MCGAFDSGPAVPNPCPVRPPATPSALVVDIAALRRKHVTHHHVDAELDQDHLRSALADTDAEIGSPGRVGLELLLQADGSVFARGSLELAFAVPCARCLEPAAVDGNARIEALFVRKGAAHVLPGEPDEDEDDGGDTSDLWEFDGQILDLRPLVAEQIKLAYPMRALCPRGEACRGLCSHCGAPLNEQPLEADRCTACGAADPRVPLVDTIPTAPAAEGSGQLAEALRKLGTPD